MFPVIVIITILGFVYYEITQKVMKGEMTVYEWIKDWIETIAVAVIYAIMARAFFLQAFFIPTGSMIGTLKPGDRLLVDKFSYNFRNPSFLDPFVFKAPADIYRDYIKRLIGMPGDVLEIKNGRLYKNGKCLKEDYVIKTKEFKISSNFDIKYIKFNNQDLLIHTLENDNDIIIPYELIRTGDKNDLAFNSLSKWNITYSKSYDRYNLKFVKGNKEFNIYLQDCNGIINFKEIIDITIDGKKIERKNFSSEKKIDFDEDRSSLKLDINSNYCFLVMHMDDHISFNHYVLLSKPFTVPKKGMKMKITEDNEAYIYMEIAYETGNYLGRDENGYFIYERHDKNGKRLKSYENQSNSIMSPGDKKYTVKIVRRLAEYEFKENHYFGVGDNRNDSLDSRYWGTVPESYLLGRAYILYYPFDRFKMVH